MRGAIKGELEAWRWVVAWCDKARTMAYTSLETRCRALRRQSAMTLSSSSLEYTSPKGFAGFTLRIGVGGGPRGRVFFLFSNLSRVPLRAAPLPPSSTPDNLARANPNCARTHSSTARTRTPL